MSSVLVVGEALVDVVHRADAEVRATLGAMHGRMMAAASDLTPAEAEVVVGFLHAVRDAVDGIGAEP